METTSAWALGDANRGKEQLVFDWDKARAIITERQPYEAIAGLSGDMEWTAGPIWQDGAPVPRENTYTYLASTWATPVIVVDGEEIDCWRMELDTPGWGAHTYWPEPLGKG